jgi:hypothetical protein
LIRSKGVGIFFVTQTPKDIPGDVLAHLANRIQHALRAFTPDDAKALKATVSTFPVSSYDLEEVLTSAGIGEAVVTVMNENGAPTPVALTRMRAPGSVMGPSPDGTVKAVVGASALLPTYGTAVDPVSAYEKLESPAASPATGPAVGAPLPPPPPATLPAPKNDGGGMGAEVMDALGGALGGGVKSMIRSMGSQLGRNLMRDMFGTAPRRRRR